MDAKSIVEIFERLNSLPFWRPPDPADLNALLSHIQSLESEVLLSDIAVRNAEEKCCKALNAIDVRESSVADIATALGLADIGAGYPVHLAYCMTTADNLKNAGAAPYRRRSFLEYLNSEIADLSNCEHDACTMENYIAEKRMIEILKNVRARFTAIYTAETFEQAQFEKEEYRTP